MVVQAMRNCVFDSNVRGYIRSARPRVRMVAEVRIVLPIGGLERPHEENPTMLCFCEIRTQIKNQRLQEQ